MSRLKIREKVLLFSILISTIPLLLVNGYWFINATTLVRRDAGEHLRTTNREITSKFDDFLNAKLLGFLSHSQGAALLSNNQQLIQTDLFNLLLQDKDITELAFVNTKGQETAKVNIKKIYAKSELKDASSTDAFKIVNFQYGKEYIGPVVYAENQLQTTIAVPIVNPGTLPALQTFSSQSLFSRSPSEIHGYLIGTVNLERLYNSTTESMVGRSGYTYVVNREGKIIIHPQKEYIGQSKNSPGSEIALFIDNQGASGNDVHETTGIEQKQVLSTHNVVQKTNWGIISEVPLDDISSDIIDVQRQALPFVMFPIVCIVAFSFFWANRLTTPIKHLAAGAHKIGMGDFSYKFSIHTHDELKTLADSLKQMAENLKDSQNKIQHERDSLQVERDKLESVLTNIDDGVIALDENYHIMFFNKAVETILKIKLQESIGRTLDSIMTFASSDGQINFNSFLKNHKADDKPILLSFLTNDKDQGRIRLAVTKITSTHDKDIKYLCTIQDVLKEQQLEEMKMDFVSMAAHELRTPLTSIRGYFALVNEQLEKTMNDEQKMFMSRIDISTQQLVALVENLLSVTRIEKGTYTLKKSMINLADLINQNLKDFESRAQQKELDLVYNKPEYKIPEVYIDQLGISEVIRNLLSNAITYTPTKGRITISTDTTEKDIIIHISDTGEGIPKEAIPHLFTKFFRVSGALEQGSKGNGLGLYISKSILEMHHGRIWVESTPDKGSTFSFSLPIEKYEK